LACGYEQREAVKLRGCEHSFSVAPRRRKGEAGVDQRSLREAAKRTDSHPQLVKTARFIRGLLPGDESVGAEALAGKVPEPVERLVSELEDERPSAMRELGFAALQAWQALSEAQRRGRGQVEVAILFTDLVGFSDWALGAGDEAALQLLRSVGDAEQGAIAEHHGAVVKRLGDGAMAVFSTAEEAVSAAFEAQRRATRLRVEGHRPKLRAGIHQGRPRKVRGDFLGVDVNIAARVGDAAGGDEILVSEATRAALDPEAFRFGPPRALHAAGTPEDLTVCSVRPSRSRRKLQ
jgi:adenylate cyclase